jgi:hypothetical protein
MTRRSCVFVMLAPFFLTNCAQELLECEICGDFDVVNFSKSELNSTDNEAVSIRRNLSVYNFSGEDYYTIWSWNEQNPDSAWTEMMKKDLEILASDLSIRENGTWSWALTAEETFQSSPYFGNSNYRVNKQYTEQGTWRYLNPSRKYIGLDLESAVLQNEVVVLDRTNPNQVLEKWPITSEERTNSTFSSRRFQVSRTEDVDNHLTLESVDGNSQAILENIHDACYSLTQGDITLTLMAQASQGKLASRMN